MILTIIFFVLLLGVLVLAHEWGHFFVARRFGVRVEEFAFGFPPRVASFVKKGTRYAFNLLPLGGYVKIFGEGGEETHNPESFSSRPLGQRFLIIVAGVVMNVILAWVLFSFGHGLGLPTVVGEDSSAENVRVTIVGIGIDSPAERAGLRFGDAITYLRAGSDVLEIGFVDDVQRFIERHRGEKIIIDVERGQEKSTIEAVPRISPPSGEGPLGIAMAKVGVVRSPWYRAPLDGLKTTASAVVAIVRALGGVVRDFAARGEVSAEVSGPIGIFVLANQTRRLGMAYLLELAGVLSVNLALLNILPFPALDGGRAVFLLIEKIRGARVSPRLEQMIHIAGFAVLTLLILYITHRDIVRFF